jgi:rhodanese-related sulfurtransferase
LEQNAFRIMRLLWIAIIAFGCGASEGLQVERIGNKELIQLLKNEEVQLIDIRTPEEVSFGIIDKAIVIDFYDPKFESKVNMLSKDKPTAIYCAAGGRSAKASQTFVSLGFTEIYDLKAGFRGWRGEGNPVVVQ